MPASEIVSDRKIVDFHVHAFPDEIAERALQALTGAHDVTATTDGTIAGTLRHMDKSGVDYSVIQPVATKPSQVKSINNWAASLTNPRIISFGAIHPDYEDAVVEIDRIVSLGLPGIKIQANWQDVYVDERRMYPIYEAAEGRLIFLFHSGGEIEPFDDMKATPKRLAQVHKDFPDLTMVVAHMGGFMLWDDVEEYLLGEDIYLDTSSCYSYALSDARFRELIVNHGSHRVLFATDPPYGESLNDIPRLLNLGLTDSQLERIFWGNARGLLGNRLSPLPCDLQCR